MAYIIPGSARIHAVAVPYNKCPLGHKSIDASRHATRSFDILQLLAKFDLPCSVSNCHFFVTKFIRLAMSSSDEPRNLFATLFRTDSSSSANCNENICKKGIS